jgi:hypothetical protein
VPAGYSPRYIPGSSGNHKEALAALLEYDRIFLKDPKGRMDFGEHVTQRWIMAAFADAASGAMQRARSEALMALNLASRADQGTMLMKARLALGEIELKSDNRTAGRKCLEALVKDADQGGFGLISREARERLTLSRGQAAISQMQSKKT